jgi:ubiquitin-protein ligase
LEINSNNSIAGMISVIFMMIDEPYKQYVANKQKLVTTQIQITHSPHTSVTDPYITALESFRSTVSVGLASQPDYKFLKFVGTESVSQLQRCYARLSSEIPNFKASSVISKSSVLMFNVDRQRYNCIRCLMTGPIGTPYAYGVFVFDIYCSSKYPNSPPDVVMVNHGENKINPNLYTSGCICMSLLNTYSGPTPFETEKWNPLLSGIAQLMISIHANIFNAEPYFNESANISTYKTPRGDRESKSYNNKIIPIIIEIAMQNPITHALSGRLQPFSSAIITHFKLMKNQIKQQCEEWIKNGENHSSVINDAYQELLKVLDPL